MLLSLSSRTGQVALVCWCNKEHRQLERIAQSESQEEMTMHIYPIEPGTAHPLGTLDMNMG